MVVFSSVLIARSRSKLIHERQKKHVRIAKKGVLDRIFGKGDPANPALLDKTFNQGTILFEDTRKLVKRCSVYDQVSTRAHFDVIKLDPAAIAQLVELRKQSFGLTEAETVELAKELFSTAERAHLFYVRAEVQDSPNQGLIGDDAAWQLRVSCGGQRRNPEIKETFFDPEVARMFYRFDDSARMFGREYIVSCNRNNADQQVDLYFLGAGVYDHLSW